MVYSDPFTGLFVLLLILVTILVIVAILSHSRKSKHYRKEVMDLYVVGKLKQLALKDGLDLDKENENFKKWLKKQKLERTDKDYELDDVIEEEIKEKVSEPITKK